MEKSTSAPKVTAQRHFKVANGEGAVVVSQMDLPGKYMDQYNKIVGNSLARVSVSADMALKEFGSGAGAMVTVTLSCNQDEATITQAIDLAGALAREYCNEQRALAENELQKATKPAVQSPFGG